MPVPFSQPTIGARERDYLLQALEDGHLSGDGRFTKASQAWLENTTGAKKALLSHSCTAALEMAGLLAGVNPGDEIIIPSFTFVSTANAFVLRGAIPVFVDVRPDTLNLNEDLIEPAITRRTRAVVPVHYAGVACEMDRINEVAGKHNLLVIEDAAQGLCATYKGQPLGTLGHLGALSFHATKNVVSGEGGALLINDAQFIERAEIIREKGTNRARFLRGAVDKYTWMDMGSSFLPGEIVAALLLAQLEQADELTGKRLALWGAYEPALEPLARRGLARLARVPKACGHNGHIFWLLYERSADREKAQAALRQAGLASTTHYVPLHTSPAGKRFGHAHGDLPVTEKAGECLLRLPIYAHMPPETVDMVSDILLRQ